MEVLTLLYILAIIFPPLAVLIAGKPFQAIVNLILTLCFYVPGLIHALLVVHDRKADKRLKKQMKMMRRE
ncbi:YqaE/Pmp3 family membrane protein [Bacillus taeanensis]|uniref:YqaE/Pmp3 family membrane protein n=1 Tax=Bacillus taeanensis TaxID=273032 RepID=A0A366XZM5_9BACI|nr:YqaE/Pmp3 family membrane protein [Bacillus taeanensis]